jgi:hypothetical protein
MGKLAPKYQSWNLALIRDGAELMRINDVAEAT